jgi:hypothetical protein
LIHKATRLASIHQSLGLVCNTGFSKCTNRKKYKIVHLLESYGMKKTKELLPKLNEHEVGVGPMLEKS